MSTAPTIDYVSPHKLELHPEADLVPKMSREQYADFLADVKRLGRIEEALKRLKGTNIIIDGRHRRQAAIDAGFATVPVVDVDLAGEDAVVYMLRVAQVRRHLTAGQRAHLGNVYLKRLKKAAKERQKEGAKKGGATAGNGRKKQPDSLVADRPQGNAEPAPAPKPARAPTSRDEAARLSGSTPKNVTLAEKIEQTAPEVYKKLVAGEIDLPAAKRAIAEPKPVESGTRLMRIRNFPSDALAHLIAQNVHTVEDLDAHVEKIRPLVKPVVPSRVTALQDLGVSRDLALRAADAIIDHQKPDPEPAAPAKPDPKRLEPCPFCGMDKAVMIWGNTGVRGRKHFDFVRCQECGADGPRVKGGEEAKVRAAWNKRAKK